MKRTMIVAAVALAASLVPTAAPAHTGVAIVGAQYVPAVAQGEVGHAIEWESMEVIDLHHQIVPDTELGSLPGFMPFPETSPELHGGEVWEWTPTEPGTFAYRCAEHLQMRGVLSITGHAE